jgi:hypothetical protein
MMNKKYGYLIAFAIAVAAPFVGYPVFLAKLLCFALFASAFNLLIGFTGLLSFGHAAFYGGAGYVAGNAMKMWGWPVELGILAGVAAGAGIGLVMGALAIRRQGIYFSMITLALAQMVYFWRCGRVSSPAARMACKVFHVESCWAWSTSPTTRPVFLRARHLRAGVRADRAHRAFAVRPGAEGGQGKRAARDFAGLRCGQVQAAGLCAVGRLVRPGGRHQHAGAGFRDLTDVHWTMSGW